jgi:hypothetical protein
MPTDLLLLLLHMPSVTPAPGAEFPQPEFLTPRLPSKGIVVVTSFFTDKENYFCLFLLAFAFLRHG